MGNPPRQEVGRVHTSWQQGEPPIPHDAIRALIDHYLGRADVRGKATCHSWRMWVNPKLGRCEQKGCWV
jgi:hypothetical protein